jgi:hypothetical protein
MDFVEAIRQDDRLLCLVVRPPPRLERTTFVTPDELNLQLGFIVTPRGGAVPRHSHRPVERRVTGTSEVVMVRSGRCTVDIYDDARNLVASRELAAGDIVVLVAGGHAFTMAEDTVLMEVKQGPYAAGGDKERF